MSKNKLFLMKLSKLLLQKMSLIRVGFARSFSSLASGQKRFAKHDEFSQFAQDSKDQDETKKKRADKGG